MFGSRAKPFVTPSFPTTFCDPIVSACLRPAMMSELLSADDVDPPNRSITACPVCDDMASCALFHQSACEDEVLIQLVMTIVRGRMIQIFFIVRSSVSCFLCIAQKFLHSKRTAFIKLLGRRRGRSIAQPGQGRKPAAVSDFFGSCPSSILIRALSAECLHKFQEILRSNR